MRKAFTLIELLVASTLFMMLIGITTFIFQRLS
ncbi:MAG: prepilin-type N-terminal cleavage/methylation domain-containing protein, partial [Planctomycetes bacterium]|nr:prepilin-type N-terminal cleavage/methylation domain-containing protein [Planctomycetota bacterium]